LAPHIQLEVSARHARLTVVDFTELADEKYHGLAIEHVVFTKLLQTRKEMLEISKKINLLGFVFVIIIGFGLQRKDLLKHHCYPAIKLLRNLEANLDNQAYLPFLLLLDLVIERNNFYSY